MLHPEPSPACPHTHGPPLCCTPQAPKAVTTASLNKNAALSLAAAAVIASVPLAEAPAMADVAGLTPCKDSKAFAKREKGELKALNRRLKQVRPPLPCCSPRTARAPPACNHRTPWTLPPWTLIDPRALVLLDISSHGSWRFKRLPRAYSLVGKELTRWMWTVCAVRGGVGPGSGPAGDHGEDQDSLR
jgi:hypothetical protein